MIPVVRPIRSTTSVREVGWVYLELSGGSDEKAAGFFSADTNIMPWLFGIGTGLLLSLAGMFVISPLSHRFRKVKNESWSFMFLVMFAALIIGSVTLGGKLGLELTVPAAPVIVASGGYAFVYLVIRSLWRYTQYGTVFDEQKRMRKKAYSAKKLLKNGDFGRDVEKKVIEMWQKRCDMYIKKGRYTAETCVEKFKKDEKMNDITGMVFNAAMLLIWLVSVIFEARGDDLVGTLIYAAIIGVLLFLWAKFVNNAMNSGAVLRKRLISGCGESGMTMPEYLAKRYDELNKTE